ncbi:MAG: DJ-1/PfpI family protein [Sphingomicrobium sp.]
MTHFGLSRRQLIGIVTAGTAGLAARVNAQTDHSAHSGHASGSSLAPAQMPEGKIPVAVMLDDAATMMDFAGPWEVFQDVAMGGGSGYFLYTVAPQMRSYNTSGSMLTDGGMHGMKGLVFTPDYTFDNAPQPKVIVMGAQMNFAGKEKISWLRKAAPAAEVVLSVCTGNFIAANAGLLDGLKATTHHRFYDQFEEQFPRVQLIREQRVVDNGKFVSGGGITAGIDAALHVVRRHFDDKVVGETIKYMEYRAS